MLGVHRIYFGIPGIAIVSYTSNTPEHDIGYDLGPFNTPWRLNFYFNRAAASSLGGSLGLQQLQSLLRRVGPYKGWA